MKQKETTREQTKDRLFNFSIQNKLSEFCEDGFVTPWSILESVYS